MRPRRAIAGFALLAALAAPVAAAHAAALAAPVHIGTGDDAGAWKAVPADGVSLKLSSDSGRLGRALRLDYDFHGGGGYAVAHRAVSLELPANYRFTFHVRGNGRPNNLEFKLIDASGDNVWWLNQRDFEFTPEGRDVAIRKRQVSFAWGPLGGGELRHVAALELAITAGQGGAGSVWIEDMRLQPLPVPDTTAHAIVARASSGQATAARAVDGDPRSAWVSEAHDPHPRLTLDLGAVRELGGLVIDWAPGRHASDYDVELSSDGRAWTGARSVHGGNGGRDWIDLPGTESRLLRVTATRVADPAGVVAIANVAVEPLAWSETPNAFFASVAKDAPRGDYPRAMRGENVFWTVVGVDDDDKEGLFDEVGRLETGKGAYTLEPFVRDAGRLVTWNDVTATPSLANGHLPIPSVEWAWPGHALAITAIAAGSPGHSAILARYRLRNTGEEPVTDTLYLALRPFQVDPPTQFLNTPGGVAPIRELARDGRVVRVNGDRGIACLDAPDAFGAATFEQGEIIEYLRAGRLPPAERMPDPRGRASGALAYVLALPAHGEREVDVVVPLHEPPIEPPTRPDSASVRGYVETLERIALGRWRERLGATTISLPDTEVANALAAQVGWVLVNRAGPAIQPGARAYARSWIRDGCLTSSALLRMGETDAVRQFIDWYAPKQYGNGKAPCCVDARGADPTPEHDSDGELIYLIAEYVRMTGDRAFADSTWPHVARAVAYLDSLRAMRRTAEWRSEANAPYFGLLPPSISHEGYSAKPMHSYWDDLFALRGYKDAAWLAALLGRPERAAIEASRDTFAHELNRSVRAAMQAHAIDYVPGCADLGDFDATSTSIALSPVQAGDALPRAALERTFERYWDFFEKRERGESAWDAFTPYEWRNVGAMVRLGAGRDSTWRARANEALRWLMRWRRPAGFQEWAEVVWRDERAPHFLGDMPHTWVGTDFVRSVLDMLAYKDEADSSVVIGAGVPLAWLAGSGVEVHDLHTRWGALSFSLSGDAQKGTITIQGEDFRMPPGGIVVRPPQESTGLSFRPPPGTRAPDMGWRVPRLPFTLDWGRLKTPGPKRSRAHRHASGSPRGSTHRSP
jgi:hypothetical protein